MHHRPIVFIDVETTGLGAQDGHILEVGLLRVEHEKVVAKFNQLLDPGVEVPWYITKITGIVDDDLKGKPQFRDIADRLEEFMDGAIFAAHNVSFDYSFFQSEYRRLGQKLQKDRFCTAVLSRTLTPQHRRHSLDHIITRGGYKVANRHRAFDDAYVLYQFYKDALATYGLDVYKTIDKIMIKTRTAAPKPTVTYVPFFE